MEHLLPIADIEQGIKDAVKKLGRNYIAEIASYGGQLDADPREFANVIKRFPAVWVTFQGSAEPTKKAHRKYYYPLTFMVLVGARSLRNEESARTGIRNDSGQLIEVGTLQLLKDAFLAVAGKDFGLPIDNFEPGKIETYFNTRLNSEAVSVMGHYFKTGAIVVIPDEEDNEAAYLDRININYISKPDETVASDLVELENQS